jgi:hypothetical protein
MCHLLQIIKHPYVNFMQIQIYCLQIKYCIGYWLFNGAYLGYVGRDSSVGIATDYGLGGPGIESTSAVIVAGWIRCSTASRNAARVHKYGN